MKDQPEYFHPRPILIALAYKPVLKIVVWFVGLTISIHNMCMYVAIAMYIKVYKVCENTTCDYRTDTV